MILMQLTRFAARFLFVLADTTVKAVLLLAAATIIATLSRRASASFRHLVWAITLTCVFFLPLLSWNLPHWRVSVTVPAAHTVQVTDEAPPLDRATPSMPKAAAQTISVKPSLSASSTEAPAPARTIAPPAAMAERLPPIPAANVPAPSAPWTTQVAWAALLCLVWITGAVILLIQMARGLAGIRSIVRGSFLVETGFLAEAALAAATQMQIGRSVGLRQASAAGLITVPLTFGILQPVVVLPAEVNEWPVERLRAALLHEMAHIKRHDWALQMLGNIAGAIYWFNPLVWMALKRMRGESEAACDDLVLAAGVPAQDYARHLLDVALSVRDNRRLRSSAVAMAQGPKVEGRLRAILAQSLSRRPVTRRAAAGSLTVALLIALPLAALRLVAQEAVVPVPAADGLQLKGNFTLRYAVDITDLTSTEAQFRQYQQIRTEYTALLKKDPYFQPEPAEYYAPFSYFQARRPRTRHVILTVSSSGKELLWRSEENGETFALVYNGRDGTQLFSNGHNGRVEPGLSFAEMENCPLPAVGLPHIPLFKPGSAVLVGTSGKSQTWRALCPIEGSTSSRGEIFYLPDVAHMVNDGGAWKALDVDSTDQQIQFLQHQRFQGLWIASQMRMIKYTLDPTPANVIPSHFGNLRDFETWFDARRRPTASCEYRLLSASDTPLDLSANGMRTVSAAPPPHSGLASSGLQLDDDDIQEALHLRYHLQDWAKSHKALLQQMTRSQITARQVMPLIAASLNSLLFPLWQGDPRPNHVWDGDPRTGHGGQKPAFTAENYAPGRNGTASDFEIARSRNPGSSHVILWASGRITRATADVKGQQEITPPFFVGTASNLAGDEPQAALTEAMTPTAAETNSYSAANTAVASGPSATLANGYVISLVGVTQAVQMGKEWDMYGNPWWRSNGNPAPPQIEGENGHWHWTTARTHSLPPYIFRVAVQPPGGRWRPNADSPISLFEQFPGASKPGDNATEYHIVKAGPHPVARDIEPALIDGSAPQYFDGLIGGTQSAELYPAGTHSCTIRCGVATGPWHIATATPSAAIPPSSPVSSSRPAHSTTVLLDMDGKPRVTCLDSQGRTSIFYFGRPLGPLSNVNWHLSAIDAAGRDVPLIQAQQSGEASGNPLTLLGKSNAATWTTSLAPNQIREFRLETRPYETVEFRNIQLQPSADAAGLQPTATTLLTQASKLQLAQARQLRDHLQSWAKGSRAALQQMAQGQPGDLSLVMPVYTSFQRLPMSLWDGDPRIPHGIDGAPFQGMLPSRLTFSHLLRSQGLFERTIRADYQQHRDLEVAQSYNAGQPNMTVWTSGRITQGAEQRELAPPFFTATSETR
ncbi:MAG: M56 family metallopeptidase [Janthinobacterium lividum]